MKKFLPIFIMFFAIMSYSAFAYIDCTPSSCAAGYTDNGVVCSGSTCIRNCTIAVCNGDWTQVFSDTVVGFNDDDNEEVDASSTYSPTDSSKCYNFTYKGSPTGSDTDMDVDAVPSGDCDSEAIGGFWDDTSRSSPWFSGMSNYLGDTSGGAEYDYLLKTMRAHTEGDDDAEYRTATQSSGKIFCAPNSQACSLINSSACDTDCYNRATKINVQQGYYNQTGSSDTTLYDDRECGNNGLGAGDYVDTNRLEGTTYYVYESSTSNSSSEVSCDRTHEAPNVSNVMVLPLIPNAGQNLLCNYTYSDPENWTEQNSSYEWYKNGVNQNINDQILSRFNLTPGERWTCKVTPSDGMLFGTQTQSGNNVTIRNATLNPTMYVGSTAVWNNSGYFGEKANVNEFSEAIRSNLDSCVADSEGYCNVSLTFYAGNYGVLNLSDLSIYYSGDSQGTSTSASLSISNLTTMYSSGTSKIFEFVILNNGTTTVTDIRWQFNTGESIINSTMNISSLAANEKSFIYIVYDYSVDEVFNIEANATGISQSTEVSAKYSINSATGLVVTNLTVLNSSGTFRLFEFKIKNFLDNNLTNVSWVFDTKNGNVINSTLAFNLTSNETIFVYLPHNFTTGTGPETFNINATARNNSLINSRNLTIVV